MRLRRLITIVLIVVVLVVGYRFYTGRSSGPEIPQDTTLVVTLEGAYAEATSPSLLMRAMGDTDRPFAHLLSLLAIAERDERLDTVILRIRSLGIGWGKIQELRSAVARLKAVGHKTIALLDVADLSVAQEYYLASAADEIYVAPGSLVPLVGLASEYVFLGDLLEELGLTIEVGRVGKYKNAVETFTESGMSDAAREMSESILDSVASQLVAGIAEGRGMTPAQVRAAIDTGPVQPEELLSLGLVDGLLHLEEIPDMDGDVVTDDVYAAVDPATVGFEPEAHFALIYAAGTVVSGRGSVSRTGSRICASDTVSEAFEEAAEDPDIDAIILRIDSPGGSSHASEAIWFAIQRAKKSGKPIIASFSDVAASGGYYVAAGADAIVAPPAAITGSIGVFSLRPVLGEAFSRVGINLEALTWGRHADFLLMGDPLSVTARERWQSSTEAVYDLFLNRVAQGRLMTPPEVDVVGQGRVWTGEQAFENGLVDDLGDLRAAVVRGLRALDMAEDADVALVPYPQPPGLADQVRELLDRGIEATARSRATLALWDELGLPASVRSVASLLADLPLDAPLLVPPFIGEIR